VQQQRFVGKFKYSVRKNKCPWNVATPVDYAELFAPLYFLTCIFWNMSSTIICQSTVRSARDLFLLFSNTVLNVSHARHAFYIPDPFYLAQLNLYDKIRHQICCCHDCDNGGDCRLGCGIVLQ